MSDLIIFWAPRRPSVRRRIAETHLSKQCTLGAQSRHWYWLDLETMGILKTVFYTNPTGPLEVIQLRVVWYCILKIKVARKEVKLLLSAMV